MNVLVIGVAVILSVVVVAWFLFTRNVPESAASHDDPDTRTQADRFSRGIDRPADPGAEVMDPDQLGGDQSPPT